MRTTCPERVCCPCRSLRSGSDVGELKFRQATHRVTLQGSFHPCFCGDCKSASYFKIAPFGPHHRPRHPRTRLLFENVDGSMFVHQQTGVLAAEEVVGRDSTDQLCSLSGFLSFLWFVAFCFLANQWQRTTMSKGVSQGADAARAAITFSFFSIVVWVSSASELRWGDEK